MNRFISLISLWLAIFILSACNAQYSPSLANDLAVNSLHLGDIEHLSGNLEKAIEWYKKSIPLFEESGDEANLQLVRDVLSTIPKQ